MLRRMLAPRLLDLPGPSRRITVEPLVEPSPPAEPPAREPAPPAEPPTREPAEEPVPA
jgi:hypothetical protein